MINNKFEALKNLASLGRKPIIIELVIESIKLLGKVVILIGLDSDLSLHEMSYFW